MLRYKRPGYPALWLSQLSNAMLNISVTLSTKWLTAAIVVLLLYSRAPPHHRLNTAAASPQYCLSLAPPQPTSQLPAADSCPTIWYQLNRLPLHSDSFVFQNKFMSVIHSIPYEFPYTSLVPSCSNRGVNCLVINADGALLWL